jgi:hypothetical protein
MSSGRMVKKSKRQSPSKNAKAEPICSITRRRWCFSAQLLVWIRTIIQEKEPLNMVFHRSQDRGPTRLEPLAQPLRAGEVIDFGPERNRLSRLTPFLSGVTT